MPTSLYQEVQKKIAQRADVSEYLFAFDPADLDRSYVQKIARGLRGLLRREDIAPKQIWSLAKLLLGTQRLPLITPGLDVSVELITKQGAEAPRYEIHLSEERLVLAYDGPGSGPAFEVDLSYRSDTLPEELAWLDQLDRIGATCDLTIEDLSDDAMLDWGNDSGVALWEHVPALEAEEA